MDEGSTSTTGPSHQEQRLISVCEIANQDPELRQIDAGLDALPDEIAEPWEDCPQ
jgi:hypothetical protein